MTRGVFLLGIMCRQNVHMASESMNREGETCDQGTNALNGDSIAGRSGPRHRGSRGLELAPGIAC